MGSRARPPLTSPALRRPSYRPCGCAAANVTLVTSMLVDQLDVPRQVFDHHRAVVAADEDEFGMVHHELTAIGQMKRERPERLGISRFSNLFGPAWRFPKSPGQESLRG